MTISKYFGVTQDDKEFFKIIGQTLLFAIMIIAFLTLAIVTSPVKHSFDPEDDYEYMHERDYRKS